VALKDYSKLPDVMDSPDIDREARELLSLAAAEDPTDVAEAMRELVLRLGRNAAPISERTLADMDAWFARTWSVHENEVLVDIMLSIALELPGTFAIERVRSTAKDATGPTAENIRAALRELDELASS